jgi:hypothetical protein
MAKRKLPTKTYIGFGLSMLDRAVKESFALRCKAIDLNAIDEFFSQKGKLQCAYCDAPNPTRWDHLHPVSRGGDTVPGNLVPACARCDDSKQNRTLEEWALSLSTYKPPDRKLVNIQKRLSSYQKKFSYSPKDFEKKMTKAQRALYKNFREKLAELRTLLKQGRLIK